MELDEAFLKAAKAFYAGTSHKNVDKYSKKPFEFSYDTLDELHKKYSRDTAPEIETPEEEVSLDEEIE